MDLNHWWINPGESRLESTTLKHGCLGNQALRLHGVLFFPLPLMAWWLDSEGFHLGWSQGQGACVVLKFRAGSCFSCPEKTWGNPQPPAFGGIAVRKIGMCFLPLMTNTVVSTPSKQTRPQFFTEVHMDIGHLEFCPIFERRRFPCKAWNAIIVCFLKLPWKFTTPKDQREQQLPQQNRQLFQVSFPSITSFHLSSDQNRGWLFYIGDYTTQAHGDYNQ